ncbi:MAG TPA: TIGR00730 family Rossman fold protein [Verrucomicrobiae bacterium]|jgi:uncharacterized protein (TIGR00730 family)|nr:TIGR00730 family Rossman fold protein [Verrucomicrobiae bacterium]
MARRKRLTLNDLVHEVEEWLKQEPTSANRDLLAELLYLVLDLAKRDLDRGDLKVLVRSLREMRRAFRLFAPYRSVRKVSIFGSARVPESDPYYTLAVEFSHRIVEEGFMVITGAGEGIMQAGHEGAGRAKSIGVNIKLPFEQVPNRFIQGDAKHMPFHFFFTRKVMFVKEGDAFVFFPGGFGTHDEAVEVLTLTQTGKSQIVPIVMVDLPGRTYWIDWLDFVKQRLLADGYISEEDLSFFRIVDSSEAAVAEIRRFYRNFHSYRYVKRELVMRLLESPSPALLRALNENFRDILTGEIRETPPLEEEKDDPAALSYPRVLVPFNRRNFGRLRQMIDVVNGEG